MKYTTTIKDLFGMPIVTVILFFALLFSCLRVGMERGITPSKVLVVDCKGKFFLQVSF